MKLRLDSTICYGCKFMERDGSCTFNEEIIIGYDQEQEDLTCSAREDK